jgi:hypothetical protein
MDMLLVALLRAGRSEGGRHEAPDPVGVSVPRDRAP